METWRNGDIETWTGDIDRETWTWRHGHRHIGTWNYWKILENSDVLQKKSNRKQKPRRFSLIRLLIIANRLNGQNRPTICGYMDMKTNKNTNKNMNMNMKTSRDRDEDTFYITVLPFIS